MAHKELNVPICESQADWIPLQRIFLEHAAKYRDEQRDTPDTPNNISAPSASKFQ